MTFGRVRKLRNDRGEVLVVGREVRFAALYLGGVVAPVTFSVDREPTRADGGDPPGRWYVVRWEPGEGRKIDSTVPDGHFRTMREAQDDLLRMYGVIV